MRNALLAASLTLLACRDSAYSAAMKTDTLIGWRQFVEENPKDLNLEAAQERIVEIEFADAQKAHTVIAYKRFIELHPDAPQTQKARVSLETLRFNAASEAATALTWRQFLKDHPDGPHAGDAEVQLAALELKALKTSTDPQAIATALAEHGEGAASPDATAKLDDVTFSQARTTQLLLTYLEKFAAGAHRDEARVQLLSRELDSLLFSLDVAGAKALLARSPLAPKLDKANQRVATAEAFLKLHSSKDPQVKRVLPAFDLRAADDLNKALEAPDALDRADAVIELGYIISPRSIDPLLTQLRASRSALVRQRAFESLTRILKLLPHEIAEFEVSTRLKKLENEATDAQLVMTQAVLLDLSGQLERATREYQRSFDPQAPDPMVLRRWSLIRRERGQPFAAAVTARQLAVWADKQVRAAMAPGPSNAVIQVRELCFARESEELAKELIDEAGRTKTEFPDDIELFARQTEQALQLANARLRDAELAMLGQNANARKCGDATLQTRLTAGQVGRIEAMTALAKTKNKELKTVLQFAKTHDPFNEVREAASKALEALPAGP